MAFRTACWCTDNLSKLYSLFLADVVSVSVAPKMAGRNAAEAGRQEIAPVYIRLAFHVFEVFLDAFVGLRDTLILSVGLWAHRPSQVTHYVLSLKDLNASISLLQMPDLRQLDCACGIGLGVWYREQ